MDYTHHEFDQSALLKGFNVNDIPGVCMCMTILWMKRHRHFNGESPQKRIEWLSSKQAVGIAWSAQQKYVDEFYSKGINGDKETIAMSTGLMDKFGGLKGSLNVVTKAITPNSKQSVLEANDFMKVRTSGNNSYYMIYCFHGKSTAHVVCAYTGASGWIQGANLSYFDSNTGEYSMKQADMGTWWGAVQSSNSKKPITKVIVQGVDASKSKW